MVLEPPTVLKKLGLIPHDVQLVPMQAIYGLGGVHPTGARTETARFRARLVEVVVRPRAGRY